jgi:hypothetical protein
MVLHDMVLHDMGARMEWNAGSDTSLHPQRRTG